MVLELQSYKFHLILQKKSQSRGSLFNFINSRQPLQALQATPWKILCSPRVPHARKTAPFQRRPMPPANPEKQPPTYRNPHISARHKYTSHIHRHCIIMCRSAHAPYSIIVLLLSGKTVTRQHVFNRPFHKHDITPESRHNSPERCGQGEGAENP